MEILRGLYFLHREHHSIWRSGELQHLLTVGFRAPWDSVAQTKDVLSSSYVLIRGALDRFNRSDISSGVSTY